MAFGRSGVASVDRVLQCYVNGNLDTAHTFSDYTARCPTTTSTSTTTTTTTGEGVHCSAAAVPVFLMVKGVKVQPLDGSERGLSARRPRRASASA